MLFEKSNEQGNYKDQTEISQVITNGLWSDLNLIVRLT